MKKIKAGNSRSLRKNKPGYFLGVDRLGRKSWKAIESVEDTKTVKELRESASTNKIIQLDSVRNGVIDAIGKDSILVTDHMNMRSTIKSVRDNDMMSIVGDSYEPTDQSLRISGTGLTINEYSKYDGLDTKFKIGSKIKSRGGRRYQVSGITPTHIIVMTTGGKMIAVKNNPDHFSLDEVGHHTDSYKSLKKAASHYGKRHTFRKVRATTNGIVVFSTSKDEENKNEKINDVYASSV